MANQEQLELLKQGVEVWNKWRRENSEVEVNLNEAKLSGSILRDANLRETSFSRADLSLAQLTRADLREANLRGADLGLADLNASDLRGIDLMKANLMEANLVRANLSSANLEVSNLMRANLSEAKINKADLAGANFNETILEKADLNGANLRFAVFHRTDFNQTNFSSSLFGNTIFAEVNLSEVHGLESAIHVSPSNISTDVLQFSKGIIPEVFLRGCGLSDWEIEAAKLYKPELSNHEINNIIYKIFDLRASQSIQISPLFISYSHADASFVEKLETYLTEKGIRFWRDVHEMKAGRMEKQVDRAMRQNPTVILILSENSTRSDWVEHEARLARELEKDLGRDVLCPIALDDSWKSAKWPARLMEQIKEYNILDYSNWKDDKSFGQVFNKMIAGLDMFYKPEK